MSNIYTTFKSLRRPLSLYPYARRVIKWNDVARGSRRYTPFSQQWGYVEEEFTETVDAARDGNVVEVIDGACDLFVVASYAAFLKLRSYPPTAEEKLLALCSPTEEFSLVALESSIFGTGDVVKTLKQSVALLYSLDTNIQYNLGEVLDSNDTKYPTMEELLTVHKGHLPAADSAEILAEEIMAIENRAKGRYTGVTFEKSQQDDFTTRYVFKNDGGKIMKPSTFKNPVIKP